MSTQDFEPDFPVSDMTIQDYFAGLALQSLLLHPENLDLKDSEISEQAFDLATQMLASRKLWTSSHDLTHIPSESMCKKCVHIYGDCSELPFNEMPIIKRNANGEPIVKCLNFESLSSSWPEDNHDWPQTASTVQGGVSKATPIKFTGPQPARATAGSAAYDLRYTPTDGDSVIVSPNDAEVLPTGLSIELPEGYAALVCSRSGLAANHGIQVLNAPGVIDSDYRGEIGVILHNTGNDNVIFRAGDRIAQLLIVPVLSVDWVSVDALGETDRGNGGFGSTGVE